jgi:hypothetical protein
MRARVTGTRFPDKETVEDESQGVPLSVMQDLARYWATDYDWRKLRTFSTFAGIGPRARRRRSHEVRRCRAAADGRRPMSSGVHPYQRPSASKGQEARHAAVSPIPHLFRIEAADSHAPHPGQSALAGDSSVVPPGVVKWLAFASVAAKEDDLQALQSRRPDSNRRPLHYE